jgi:pimeloyl-ACP methyl ester carboxylesterase
MVSCDAGMSPTRGQVIINNRNVSFLRWGSDLRHIVLLHGITSSARSWWRVAPVLANLGFTVTAFDMPGHGESGSLPTHEIDAIAAHITAACSTLDITPHIMLGHSWGGAVAICATPLLKPEMLILVDPLIALDDTWAQQAVPRFVEGIGQAMHQTTPWLTARNKLWHRCDIHWKAEALEQCRREAVDGLFLHSGSWNLVAELAALATPTLCLVAGGDTTVISAADQAAMDPLIVANGGHLHKIEGTDHNMHRTGFDLTLPVLLHWIKQGQL